MYGTATQHGQGWEAVGAVGGPLHGRHGQALLAAKADPNSRDSSDSTPLHYAALLGSADLAKLLLSAGADSGARDADGQTPAALARLKIGMMGSTSSLLQSQISDGRNTDVRSCGLACATPPPAARAARAPR